MPDEELVARPFRREEVDAALELLIQATPRTIEQAPEVALQIATEKASAVVRHRVLAKPHVLWEGISLFCEEVPDAAAVCARVVLYGLTHIDQLWTHAGGDRIAFHRALHDDDVTQMYVTHVRERLSAGSPLLEEVYGRLSHHSHRLGNWHDWNLDLEERFHVPALGLLLISFYVALGFEHYATREGLESFAKLCM